MTKRMRDNIIYGCIALSSVIFLLWIIPAYTPAYPGYGVSAALLPNVAVSIMLFLSLLALVHEAFVYASEKKRKATDVVAPDESDPDEDQVKKVNLGHLVRFLIPCVLVMPAMQWMGYIPAGILFLLAVQYLGLRPRLRAGLLVATIPVGIMYVAMRYGLGVPLP